MFKKYIKYKKKYLELIKSMKGGTLTEKIHKIEGPCTLSYYNIPLSESLTKKILIMGENHIKFDEQCKDESCIDIIDFLTELTKDKCIDFFLEFSPKKTEGYYMHGGDPLIIELRRFAIELQKKKNVRIQKWDLRSLSSSDGISNPPLQGHKILLINNFTKEFLSNYSNNFTKEFLSNYSNKNKDEKNKYKYRDNIKEIHMYLYGLKDIDYNIRHMISMMSIYNIDIYNIDMNNSYIFKSFRMTEIMKINEDISEKFDHDEYIQLLKFIISILDQIKNSGEDYVIEVEEDRNMEYEKYPDSQILYYDPKSIDIAVNIKKNIDTVFIEEIEKYSESLIKTQFMNYVVIIKKYINEIIYIKNIKKAFENEILFYREMVIIKEKIDKLYAKFLLFCNLYPDIFGSGRDIKETLIDIITSETNFDTRFNPILDNPGMGLNSAVSDLYAIMRMFTIFDPNKNGPDKCSDTYTPQYIIMYAGTAHTSLYESLFDYYEFKKVIQIYDKEKEPLYKYKDVLQIIKRDLREKRLNLYKEIKELNEKIKKIDDILLKKERDLIEKKVNLKYEEIKILNLETIELDEKIKEIDDILSKMSYSDRSVNLMNSYKTVNYLITNFLSD